MHQDKDRWLERARAVVITRDDWGIAHIRGRSDADAVFGLMFAQAEDDFRRIETNYLTALGRMAEAEGETFLYSDLRMRLFLDPLDLQHRYAGSPDWLKQLMIAWADGLNFFLACHPQVRPRVIHHFEPWMALSFTEGSVGGDIERISIRDLASFHGASGERELAQGQESRGSNGIAISSANTVHARALLLINPHPDLFFRAEVQLESEEGLAVYGTVTWGQFFIYQGFNERIGWSHTTTGVDAVDEYAETIVCRDDRLFYRYGAEERAVQTRKIEIACRTPCGQIERRRFSAYRTHHGPIVRSHEGKWISVSLMDKPVEALTQSFLRMKATSYRAFLEVAQLKANALANAIYADADGNIAYFHPQFIPRRDDRFDFTRPVDGADPATDWHGIHELDEAPHVLNPPNGWLYNTNNWPYSAAGEHSPRQADYPRYMDTAGENPRGVHALSLLKGRKDFTLESLIAAAFDPHLPGFARLLPALLEAFDSIGETDETFEPMRAQIEVLRGWDRCWSSSSVATTLAVFWGEQLLSEIGPAVRQAGGTLASFYDYLLHGQLAVDLCGRDIEGVYECMLERTSAQQKLQALERACARLIEDFGTWQMPWGEINRLQRPTGELVPGFDDARPSVPVPFTSSFWGALASFKSRRFPGTRRRYGTSGNSFVAVVEFGDTVRALAVTPGGASADPASPHFEDQSARFASGELREVYFYPWQLEGHIEVQYRPGEPSFELQKPSGLQ